jgi:hypothetical protein
MELTKEQLERNREKAKKHFQSERLDTDNPDRPQNIPLVTSINEDEDENTAAKSLIDEIIEETESEPVSPAVANR